ncbi:MAG: hypothetical protein V4550_05630 [Gemmatimonadota bacterium]
MKRRESAPLLFSVAIHVVLAIVILNAAFHYDFSGSPRIAPDHPKAERVTYMTMPPAGLSTGNDSSAKRAKAAVKSSGLIAPLRVPTVVTPSAVAVGGSPSGVAGASGAVGGPVSITAGIVPAQPDPRLTADAHAFYPEPKTHAQRVDSAVKASILAYNDSVAKVLGMKGRDPGDWTFQKNGQKWGIDGSKIYLGKFAIPSAVLAALPIRLPQGNPGEGLADRLAPSRRADLLIHADAAAHNDEFNAAVKRIRERKDKERAERQRGEDPRPVANPDIVP